MPVSVTMPRLGESVSEGTVTRWLKKAGERVEADEPLLEVSTDKVDTEIPSPASGVLTEIKVGEDETVDVGVELAIIDDGAAGEASCARQARLHEPAPAERRRGRERPTPRRRPSPTRPPTRSPRRAAGSVPSARSSAAESAAAERPTRGTGPDPRASQPPAAAAPAAEPPATPTPT